MYVNKIPPADDVVEKTLFELDIIAKIGKGQKISASDSACINITEKTFVAGMTRWANGDSRDRLMPIIEMRVNTANFIVKMMLESRHLDIYNEELNIRVSEEMAKLYEVRVHQAGRLTSGISKVTEGLTNLSHTYYDDNFLIFKLSALAKVINSKIVPPLVEQLKALGERKTMYAIRQRQPVYTNLEATSPISTAKLSGTPTGQSAIPQYVNSNAG